MDEEQKEGDRAAAHQEHGADLRDVKGENKWLEGEPVRLDVHENSPALPNNLREAKSQECESEENWDRDEKERVGDWENAADTEKENCNTSANGGGNKARARLRQSFVRLGHAVQVARTYHDAPNM